MIKAQDDAAGLFPKEFLFDLGAHQDRLKESMNGILGRAGLWEESVKGIGENLRRTLECTGLSLKQLELLAAPSPVFAQMSQALAEVSNLTSIARMESISATLERQLGLLDGGPLISGIIGRTYAGVLPDYSEWQKSLSASEYLKSVCDWSQPLRESIVTKDLVSVGTGDASPELLVARQEMIRETGEYIELSLPASLGLLDPRLLRMWEGSWSAFRSNSPDRIRQCLVSARELFTHVVHALAPTEQVKEWSNEPEHVVDGKPTRRARLQFITSGVKSNSLRKFLQKDIAASVELFDVLNNGTHAIDPEFSDYELRLILLKLHSALCTLVEMKTKGAASI